LMRLSFCTIVMALLLVSLTSGVQEIKLPASQKVQHITPIILTDLIPRVLLGVPEVPIKKELPHKQVSRGNSGRKMFVEVTAYNWTGYRCANMEWPIDGTTIAMNDLPFGTHVYIPGIGERIVQDRPDNKTQLDIYMGHRKQDAMQFGRQKLKVIVRD